MENNLQYQIDGIIKIPSGINEQQYNTFAEKISRFLDMRPDLSDRKYISFDELPFAGEILNELINERLANTLKNVFDQPILFPDFVLQVNNIPGDMPIPHFDLQSYTRYGTSQALEHCKYAKIGFYFQKNDEENPGSIWYAPGSHKSNLLRIISKHITSGRLKEWLLLKWKTVMKRNLIPYVHSENTYAIFDGRLLHSSSPKNNRDLTDFQKYSIYFSVVGSKDDAIALMKNEIEKFALEVYSNKQDDSQRIGYMFSNPLEKCKTKLDTLGLKYVDLSSHYFMQQK